MTTDPMACRCVVAIANAKRHGRMYECDACGATVEPPTLVASTAKTQRTADAHVERAFSPVTAHVPKGLGDMLSPAYAWGIADLVLLTRWAGSFYGSGLKLREPVQHSGGDGHGREDEKTREWHRVAMVHRRFEAMKLGSTRTHYAVLWFVVFERGGSAADLGKGLMVEIGERFIPKAQQKRWGKSVEIPRTAGRRLWDAAVKSWESGERAVPTPTEPSPKKAADRKVDWKALGVRWGK